MKVGDTWYDYKYYNPFAPVALIPTMTSDTTPSGTASASSVYSSAMAAWKAFDGDAVTYWNTPQGTTTNSWVQYMFPEAVEATRAEINFELGGTGLRGKSFKLQGTTDGISLVDLTETITVPNEKQLYSVQFTKNTGSYRGYRLHVFNAYDTNHIGVCVFQLFDH